MTTKLVSVIITTYNSSNTISDTIKSVLTQTYKNIEVIVVDDCSLDNTITTVEKLNQKNIKIIKLDKNSGGPAYPRNIGIDNAKGFYIAFLDSDDLWHPRKIELQVSLHQVKGIQFSSYEKLNFTDDVPSNKTEVKMNLNSYSFNELVMKNKIVTSGTLINTRVLKKYNFNTKEKFVAVEDFLLWLTILKNEKINAYIINEKLVYYRIHNANISKNKIKMIKKFYHVNRYFNPVYKSFLNTTIYIFKSLCSYI